MTKLPSPSEIQTNKRLRLLCNELASINASVTDSEMKGCDDARNRLPARVVDAINALNADRADLMAIRQTLSSGTASPTTGSGCFTATKPLPAMKLVITDLVPTLDARLAAKVQAMCRNVRVTRDGYLRRGKRRDQWPADDWRAPYRRALKHVFPTPGFIAVAITWRSRLATASLCPEAGHASFASANPPTRST